MKNKKIFLAFVLIFSVCSNLLAHPINMDILAEIESSNNPRAWNKNTDARGLYQITPIVWSQFIDSLDKRTYWIYVSTDEGDGIMTSYVIRNLKEEDLFDGCLNKYIANWYLDWLSERCDTVDEILIAWNWGIGNLRKWRTRNDQLFGIKNISTEEWNTVQSHYLDLPKETRDFLRKYHELENKQWSA